MEEQFNSEAKEGWRFAADAARITDERASRRSEAHMVSFFCGSRQQPGSSSWSRRRCGCFDPRQRRKHCPSMGECQRRCACFLVVFFWHSEGWTPRNEALLEAVVKQKVTRHPWLVAYDANMCPGDFEKSLRFQRDRMHVAAPKEASTCRSISPQGEWIEKNYDNVIAGNSLKGKITQMEVVEDFESRPHKAVSFVVKREKEIQEWNGPKLPKVLPGFSGGKVVRKKH